MKSKKLIIIDNYDSFTYNLYYYFCALGIKPVVVKNDFLPLKEALNFIKKFEYIVISPGFGSPQDAGISKSVIKHFAKKKKILGVCLGHQCIAEVFGGEVKEMEVPLHAKQKQCDFKKSKLTKGLKKPLIVGLYHSLYVYNLGECKLLCATDEKIPMIIKHKKYKIYGVQFHPESILQKQGKKILKNFLKV